VNTYLKLHHRKILSVSTIFGKVISYMNELCLQVLVKRYMDNWVTTASIVYPKFYILQFDIEKLDSKGLDQIKF